MLRTCDDGRCVVGVQAFVLDAEVEAHNIALFDDRFILTRGRVHDDVVDGEAQPRRVRNVGLALTMPVKCEYITVGFYKLARFVFELPPG